MAQPKLSIILVSYNSWRWLEPCLRSFRHVHGVEWGAVTASVEVIVVDNGSTEPTAKLLKKHFPWVKFIGLDTNQGFAVGNNVGLQQARGQFLMLLNTDTEFPVNTDLLSLLDIFAVQPQVAVVTPRVELPSGKIDHACHRGFPTLWNSWCYFSGLYKLAPWSATLNGYLLGHLDLDQPHAIAVCSGAAMVVRREALKEVGLLDEAYFMYAEDIDWCYRFYLAGWQVWYEPTVRIVHHKHKSGLGQQGSWEIQSQTITAFYDTMKQFFRKFYTSQYPRLIMYLVFFMIDWLKYRKLQRERKKYAGK